MVAIPVVVDLLLRPENPKSNRHCPLRVAIPVVVDLLLRPKDLAHFVQLLVVSQSLL